MSHVVAEPCYECKHTDCVVVCPVECFHEGPKMLYIHPEDCIDCEACVPECPEEAIFHEEHLPADWVPFRDLNATMARQTPPVAGRVDRTPRGGGSPKSPGGLGYTSAQDD